MFDRNNGGFAKRPMVQGNWKCSQCGAEITELPFEPSGDRPISCKDCWRNSKPQRNSGDRPQRSMVQGNWKCSECGAEITEMPFAPSDDRPIYCKDCWRKHKPQK